MVNYIVDHFDESSEGIYTGLSENRGRFNKIRTSFGKAQRYLIDQIKETGDPELLQRWNEFIEKQDTPLLLEKYDGIKRRSFWASGDHRYGQIFRERQLDSIRLLKEYNKFFLSEPLLTKEPIGPVTQWDRWQQAGYLQCDLPQSDEFTQLDIFQQHDR